MKAIGIIGSPRVGGNTEILTKHTLKAIEEEGLTTELIRLAGLDIRPCNACMVCKSEEGCPIEDDLFPLYNKMKEAEAIILASPVYFSAVPGLLKAFIERAGYIAKNNKAFVGKVGGPLVVARRGGANFTFSELPICCRTCRIFSLPMPMPLSVMMIDFRTLPPSPVFIGLY